MALALPKQSLIPSFEGISSSGKIKSQGEGGGSSPPPLHLWQGDLWPVFWCHGGRPVGLVSSMPCDNPMKSQPAIAGTLISLMQLDVIPSILFSMPCDDPTKSLPAIAETLISLVQLDVISSTLFPSEFVQVARLRVVRRREEQPRQYPSSSDAASASVNCNGKFTLTGEKETS